MQQILRNRFAPRWVIVIYVMSVVEAVGLAIHFNVRLADPEMASMQPLSIETQEASSSATAQSACPRCELVAKSPQHESIKRDYAHHDGSGRQRESR